MAVADACPAVLALLHLRTVDSPVAQAGLSSKAALVHHLRLEDGRNLEEDLIAREGQRMKVGGEQM